MKDAGVSEEKKYKSGEIEISYYTYGETGAYGARARIHCKDEKFDYFIIFETSGSHDTRLDAEKEVLEITCNFCGKHLTQK